MRRWESKWEDEGVNEKIGKWMRRGGNEWREEGMNGEMRE
jgi:hypothetical protein